jgi:hypothetical protein
MFVHGTLIDQNLKGQVTDFLDGEKVLVEGCFLMVTRRLHLAVAVRLGEEVLPGRKARGQEGLVDAHFRQVAIWERPLVASISAERGRDGRVNSCVVKGKPRVIYQTSRTRK